MRRLLLSLALWGLPAPGARAQFGQNHVVTRDFQWKVRSTEHFDVYYYPESEPLVRDASEILERAFQRVNAMLDISVVTSTASARKGGLPKWERRPFFLYTSPNEFIQSNIVQTGFGTGGVTEPFKDRFMVYNDGSHGWLEEVITHEFTHIMQYYVLVSGFWKSARVLKSIVYPLWMMEGMAGWATKEIEEDLEEYTIRDAATSGGLLSLVKLEHFGHLKPHQITLAYKQGAAAMEFLTNQYGPKKVGELLRTFEGRVDTSAALHHVIGLDAFEFDEKYREYLETKYARLARLRRLREPEAFGERLTKPDKIPQFNTSAVFTADGSRMFFMSTRTGFPAELYEKDMKSGRTRRLVKVGDARTDNVSLGNFANISRVLSLSPDERTIAYAGTKNFRDLIFLYDRRSGRLEKRELPGFEMVNTPRFSPDGGTLVFSGMKNSVTDLYLYDLKTRAVERLTDDPQDDQMPAFTPRGDAVVYSSEVLDPADPYNWGRRLYRLKLSDRSIERLEDLPGASRDPLPSPDGSKVLFILAHEGFSELCELDLASKTAVRLTRSMGASFTPAYVGEEIAFSSLRRGDVHVFKGPRGGFLAEPVAEENRELSRADKFLFPGMGAVAASTQTAALGPERPYAFSAGTDLFLPALFFSSPGGLFATTYWQGSDLLGNHGAGASLTMSSYHSFFNYSAQYSYARWRPQFFAGAAGFGERELFDASTQRTFNAGQHAQYAGVAYPLDQYHRVETAVESVTDKVVFTGASPRQDFQSRVISGAFVRDNVSGRYLVPTRGSRLRLSYAQAVDTLGGNQRFDVSRIEAHQYVPLGSQSALALRASGVQSYGRDGHGFILGGVGGVRGYPRSTGHDFGNRLTVANAELRFPIFRDINYYMWYFFPDFYFKALFGRIFTDAGYAWNRSTDISRAHWRDLRQSVGVGVQLFTFVLQEFPFVVSLDYARVTTEHTAGILYVYLGSSF